MPRAQSGGFHSNRAGHNHYREDVDEQASGSRPAILRPPRSAGRERRRLGYMSLDAAVGAHPQRLHRVAAGGPQRDGPARVRAALRTVPGRRRDVQKFCQPGDRAKNPAVCRR